MTPPPNHLKSPFPKIGVLAPTTSLATSLAKELGIRNALSISPQTIQNSQTLPDLAAILITEDCWPPTPLTLRSLLPALTASLGYIFRVSRTPTPPRPTAQS